MRVTSLILVCLFLLVTPLVGCQRDTTPPEIISTFPSFGQFDIERSVEISIGFTEAMSKSSVEKNFNIVPAVEGSFTWSGNTVTFTPQELLMPATEYTISFVQPPSDTAGNELAGFNIKFTTHAPVTNAYSIQSYQWMTDSKGLVMSANIEDTHRVYLLSSDGKTQRALNTVPGQQLDPYVSHDGKFLVYVSSKELSVYDLSQQKVTQIPADIHGDLPAWPVFSPDGSRIAFMSVLGYADAHSDLYQSLYVLERNQSNSPVLYSPPGDTDWLLGFSKDSRKAYVLGTYEYFNHGRNFRYDVWEIDLTTGQQVCLSDGGPIHNFSSGDLHPEKPQFVYGAWEPKEYAENIIGSPTHVYVVDMAPFKQTKITTSGRNAHPSFSPDGSRIVFAADKLGVGVWEIYTINPDGSSLKQLTSTNVPKLYPKWSPDGTKISFIQVEGEANVLYVMNADGTQVRRVTH